jgi:uncharacterized damage-inducible protein DinB
MTNRNLIEQNAGLLEQALRVLLSIDPPSYTGTQIPWASSSIGAQVRHVVEFYECLLDGLEDLHVDYNARRRDCIIETSRDAAIRRIEEIGHRLRNDVRLRTNLTLWVQIEDAGPGDGFLMSSVARELQALTSHTIHHYALIAMMLRAAGHEAPAEFGVAPSTLRYWAARAGRKEAA